MSGLKELIDRKAALDAEIAAAQAAHRAEAVARIRELMEQAGMTPADLSPRRSAVVVSRNSAVERPVKYRDPATGAGWSGMGKRPHWLRDALAAGQSLDAFAAH